MMLLHVFENQIISKGIWPPWSPELTHLDYYLWGPVRGTFYKDSPQNLFELKEAIANFTRNISLIELSHVIANKICICVYKHTGAISNICWNFSMRNVFV
jgi:hypothetical protein